MNFRVTLIPVDCDVEIDADDIHAAMVAAEKPGFRAVAASSWPRRQATER